MEIPANMLERLTQIAEAIPLETSYAWTLPATLPPEIQIPAAIIGSYSKNIYLKENLAPVLEQDTDLHVHYWVIRDWGGISTFKISDDNNERIKKFKEEVSTGKLTQPSFGAISSLCRS